MNAFWHSNFIIKLRSWEYWPYYVVYAPVAFYWFWLSIKAKSFFFFTATNPSMKCGGLVAESKKKILDLIPSQFVPITLLFSPTQSFEEVESKVNAAGLTFPVIAKPDVGERGIFVEKIKSSDELRAYVQKAQFKFQVQEYVDMPMELGVFYYRFPTTKTGVISSIVKKKMLSVKGDGHSTIMELIVKSDRAKLQLANLAGKIDLEEVLPVNLEKELVSIGNHCKGTTFLNGNDLINDVLIKVFDNIHAEMQGFNYGRFDLRCSSIEHLYKGEFKIMELNGAAAEPAHIYHPGFSLFKAYKVLFAHWKKLYEIGIANHKMGVPFLEPSVGWPLFWSHFKKDKYTSGQLG